MAVRKRKKRKSGGTGLGNLYVIITNSFIGKILFYAALLFILVLLALALSSNDFDRFFKFTGIGLLIITAVSWISYIFSKQ